MKATRDYTITSVKKALDILKLFDDQHPSLTLSEISERSGIGKSSMLRFLYTLLQEDFVAYDEVTKKYSLGIELYRLGLMKFNSLDLRKIARRHLQTLSNELNMICYVGIREGDTLAMVDQILPITDRQALLELIRQARRDHYSGNIGENEEHIYSLCAPVYGLSGTMVAGVSLCGLQDVVCSDQYDSYLQRIRQVADNISRELGYSPK